MCTFEHIHTANVCINEFCRLHCGIHRLDTLLSRAIQSVRDSVDFEMRFPGNEIYFCCFCKLMIDPGVVNRMMLW